VASRRTSRSVRRPASSLCVAPPNPSIPSTSAPAPWTGRPIR